eukprot:tig00020675_g12586.t1
MTRLRKRARRADDEEAQLQAPAVAPAAPAIATSPNATEDSIRLETLPDAVLERIFAEFLGAAESWRTARRASRRLRSVVEGMEWSELRFSTSRADALEALSAVVRSGKLRLRRGAAAVDLELVYPASDELLATDLCGVEVETHELSRAACDVLRSAMAAAGGLQEARVRSLGGILDWPEFAKDANRMLRTHTVNVLLALHPHAHGASSAAASTLRAVSIGGDNCCPSNQYPSRLPTLRRALAPFSSLQSLSLPVWWPFDAERAAALADCCPELRSLLVGLQREDAFRSLSPLPLEELRIWNDDECTIVCGDGFSAFAEGPAGRSLRVLGDATLTDYESAGLIFSADALRAFARLPRLERTDLRHGIGFTDECTYEREDFAQIGGPPNLRELQVQLNFMRGVEEFLGVADGIARAASLVRLDLNINVLGDPVPGEAEGAVRALLEAAAVPLSSATVNFDDVITSLYQIEAEEAAERCFRAAGPLGAAIVDGGWHWRRGQV